MKIGEASLRVLPVLGAMMLAGAGGPWTTSVTGTEGPLLPTIVTGYVPGAQLAVPRTRMALPGAGTGAG